MIMGSYLQRGQEEWRQIKAIGILQNGGQQCHFKRPLQESIEASHPITITKER